MTCCDNLSRENFIKMIKDAQRCHEHRSQFTFDTKSKSIQIESVT